MPTNWIDQVTEVRKTPYYTLYSLPGEKPKPVDPPVDENESDLSAVD